jgi:hypothetical protein
MSKPDIVITLPQPYLGKGVATYIVIPHAQPIDDRRWITSAVIHWPDGSYDVGASGLISDSKKGAESLAESHGGQLS